MDTMERLRREFKTISDPDALRIIPELAEVFEEKKRQICDRDDLSDEVKADVLYRISRERRNMGIDKRERDIRKKK